jgi:hypothetical protein
VHEQILSPGMKDRQKADGGAQVFGICCNATKCFRDCTKEYVVDDFFVLQGNGSNALRQSENNMEVFDGQKLRLMVFEPFSFGQGLTLWAVAIPARVIADSAMAAVVALIEVAAERGGAAHLDGMHDLSLFGVHAVGMKIPISRTMQTKDVGYFQRRPGHESFAAGRFLRMDRL